MFAFQGFLGLQNTFLNTVNITIFISILLITFLLFLGTKISLVSYMWSYVYSIIFDTIANFVGKKEAEKHIKFLFFVFVIILTNNLLGLIPGVETFSSRILSTFAFTLLAFLYVIIVGFKKHGIKIYKVFIPGGIPIYIKVFIFLLELISFLVKPITLFVRLFINVATGHFMLHIMDKMLLSKIHMIKFIGFFMAFIIYFFEFFTSCFQAYIFIVMLSSYLGTFTEEH